MGAFQSGNKKLSMSTNPFQTKAGGTTAYENRLNKNGDVHTGVDTRKMEDFLNNVINRFSSPWITFEDVFKDEGEKKLICDSLEYNMGYKKGINNAADLEEAVKEKVKAIQSETLKELKKTVQEILTDVSANQ